jgi:carboxypeptidase Q
VNASPAKKLLCYSLVLLMAIPLQLMAAGTTSTTENIDYETITLVRQEGFKDSKVMEIMSELVDRIGPRLTGSPNVKRANEWTRDQLAAWGLQNAHLEAWGPFGRGWSQEFVSVRMTSPDVVPLVAIPMAWAPGTNGVVTGKAVAVKIERMEDFEKYRGKLAGAIVMFGDARDVRPHDAVEMHRYDDKGLQDVADFDTRPRRLPAQFNPQALAMQRRIRDAARKFWADEKVAAIIEPARGDGGTIFVQQVAQNAWKPGNEWPVATLAMEAENYGRISRLLARNVPVELELDVRTKFYDDAATQYNTVAEIPGVDPKLKDEVVMLGAHLDSWHGGTGATDNAAGCAVMMEAVRILKALGVKPRRTIRIALWTGEEQGLLGSRAYAAQHFGVRQETDADRQRAAQLGPGVTVRATGPLQLKPEQAKIAAYFNVDNGTGRIRGIYAQENAAVVPIFEQWFTPFHDLEAHTITMRTTGGTDHLSFDDVGIPGFQFIQDEIEYDTRTHHSNMDVYERIQPADMMQNAVIVAAFVYEAAMRDQMLPRKPLPKDQPQTQQQKSQFIPLQEPQRAGNF